MTSYHRRLWRGSVLGSAFIALLHIVGFASWAQTGGDKIQGILVLPAKPGATNAQDLISLANDKGVTGIHGVVVRGPDFLRGADFKALLNKYLGTQLTFGTNGTLAAMQRDIIRYCRAEGHLVVDVFFPEQDVLEGTIQIVVIEGKIGK